MDEFKNRRLGQCRIIILASEYMSVFIVLIGHLKNFVLFFFPTTIKYVNQYYCCWLERKANLQRVTFKEMYLEASTPFHPPKIFGMVAVQFQLISSRFSKIK